MKSPTRSLRAGIAGLVAFALLAVLALAPARVSAEPPEVGPITLVVADLDRELAFYTRTLSFERFDPGPTGVSSAAAPTHTGDSGAAAERSAWLRLGDEHLQLLQFPHAGSRPIPADSRSFDHWFQHVAIVVRDMDRAYARLREHRVRPISTAPQTLPEWNPAAGGIRAFYFADPEDHVLEIIWFPPGKGRPKWQTPPRSGVPDSADPLFLGIDHTAIVVADTDRSLGFYRNRLGLEVAGGSENWGTEQEHLNQVFGARLRITTLRGARGPGIELLEYLTPPGGRPRPTDARVTDLLAWRTSVRGAPEGSALPQGPIVARAADSDLVRDPDGHLLAVRH